ncbi:maleylacetate reductase [[Mycobacterium] crassicus]|uniref:Maleylacetate reductase n=1 Tax=[Mycobacterium] crassicus TaxID=2872309 RepID=A0ABU5XIL7_9MYCO|nr:maleylacetate reductase [Mycolicibacter sp. MYC098]MEB3022130.1 maleylacetate reductase [Mycolicibacter sp. MYC098]
MLFEHENLPQRICFGAGAAAAMLTGEVKRLGAERVMVIASPAEAARSEKIVTDLPVVHQHNEVAMHVPTEVAERARAAAAVHRVDALVCIGGGSATGLAKAIALSSGLPIVAVPTTYAGSEATAMWGLTEGDRKSTGVDPRVLPRAVIYDAELTRTLPVPVSVASGLNAIAHSVDAMWGPHSDPIDRALAQEGIRALRIGLPQVVSDPMGLSGREYTLYGAYLSAVAFSSAGSGFHHKICHVLGGTYNLPHAQTHAVVLPYVLAFNASAAPEAAARIAAALEVPSAIDGLERLREQLDAPRALGDYGFDAADIDDAVEIIRQAVPASNPRPVTAENLRRLLYAAWRGSDPRTVANEREE